MRRLALALVMLSSPMSALPSHAQWWGAGGPGPCDGPCRPWAGRVVGFGPLGRPIVVLRPRPWFRRWAFEPGGFGWRPAFRRWPGERRWVVVVPRREAVEVAPPAPPTVRHRAPPFAMRGIAEAAQTRPARPEAPPIAPRVAQRRAPAFAVRAAVVPHPVPPPARPAQSAVAVMPVAVLPPARDVPHAVIRSSVLSTAVILHRARHPRPVAEPAALRVPPRPHRDGVAPARAAEPATEPATLRSEPAPRNTAPKDSVAPPAPANGAPGTPEVPAAPLD